jgi:hypothetical protein
MRTRIFLRYIILFTIITLVILGNNIYFSRRKSVINTTQQKGTSQNIDITNTEHSPIIITGCKTYTNEDFKYQLECVDNAKVMEYLGTINKNDNRRLKDHVRFQTKISEIIINSWKNPDKLELIDWLITLRNDRENTWNNYTNPKINAVIGDTAAFVFWLNPISSEPPEKPGKCSNESGGCPSYFVYFTKENYAYQIIFDFYKEYDSDIENQINIIFSTFHFTK